VPAFLLLLLANLNRKRSEQALAREQAITLAKLAAAHESFYVRESQRQLATMTQFPMALTQDSALAERGLKSLKRLQPDFDDFGLMETNGALFSHTLGSNVTQIQIVNPTLFQKVLNTRRFSASVFQSEKALSLQFGYPVFRPNGAIARVMYASLKGRLLSDTLTNLSLVAGAVVNVFDSEGRLLARSVDADKYVGQHMASTPLFQKTLQQREGVFEIAGLDGIERLYAVSTVADRNSPVLFVAVGIPRYTAFARADAAFGGGFTVALVSVALLLIAGWWYSEQIFVRPAKALVGAAEQIEKGNLSTRTGLPKGESELHRLAAGFDRMAASLEKRQSELEQANQQIKSHNAQLERHVAERTSELRMLNGELEAFSYSVSHDLRAPLRHMHGFAQMLQADPKLQEDTSIQRKLSVITAAATQMSALIDDLLAFSQMGRQSLTMGNVDFAQTVKDVVAETIAREPGREIDWRIESLPEVYGDAGLLRLVWVNLISNAVKYSKERKPAIISISAGTKDDETVLAVQDNGAGFDMAYADKLFGVFQRLHRDDEFEGTGIGLATVQRIVTRHGGRTWAEGKVGEGATFYFSIPKHQ